MRGVSEKESKLGSTFFGGHCNVSHKHGMAGTQASDSNLKMPTIIPLLLYYELSLKQLTESKTKRFFCAFSGQFQLCKEQ